MLTQLDRTNLRPFRLTDHPFEDLFGTLSQKVSSENVTRERLHEDASSFSIELDLPGVLEDELNVQIQKDRVVVSVEVKEKESRAQRFNQFKRAFRFRTALDTDNATADLSHGILRIQLPKAASAVPRTLTINASQ